MLSGSCLDFLTDRLDILILRGHTRVLANAGIILDFPGGVSLLEFSRSLYRAAVIVVRPYSIICAEVRVFASRAILLLGLHHLLVN